MKAEEEKEKNNIWNGDSEKDWESRKRLRRVGVKERF